jgi:hypothetical protein
MSQTIVLKRSSVAGKVPTIANLELGELSTNTTDGKFHFKRLDDTIQGIVTTNSLTSGSISISGSFDVTGSTYLDGSLDVTGTTYLNGDLSFTGAGRDILMVDNSGASLEFKQGSDVYLRFVTTNGGEQIQFSKTVSLASTTVGGSFAQAGGLTSLSGTSITGSLIVTGTATFGTYTGQSSIVTLGTVTTGSVTAILPNGTVSGSAQTIANLPIGSVSSSAQTIANLPTGTVSGSAQTIANLPIGSVSSSVQVDHDQTTNFVAGEHFLQSAITTVGTVTAGDVSAILPTGTVSGSAQLPTGTISGSVQVDHDQTTNFVANEHIDWTSTTENLYTTGTATTGTQVISGSLTISGSLVVLGETIEAQISELRIEDKKITLASGSVNGASADGAGIEIDRGSDVTVSMSFNDTSDVWEFSKGLTIPTPFIANGTQEFQINTLGQIILGTDVNLYRNSANVLKTDDSVIIGSNLTLSAGSLSVTNTAGTGATFTTTSTGASPDVLIVDGDNSNARAALQVQGNAGAKELLFVASGGYVGIGTTAPSTGLYLSGSSNLSARISLDKQGIITVLSSNSAGTEPFVGTTSNNTFGVITNNTVAITVSTGQAVTISGSLTVGSTTNTARNISLLATGSQYAYINLGHSSAGQYGWQVGKKSAGDDTVGTDKGFYIYDLLNSRNQFAIDISGSTSIGVVTGARKPLLVKSSGSFADGITLEHSGNTVPIASLGQSGSHGSLVLRSNASVPLTVLRTDGGNSFINTGSFGIGTANPSALLHLYSSAPFLKLEASSGTNYTYQDFTNTAGSLRVGLENSSGGALLTGTSAYAGVFGQTGAYPLQFSTTNKVRMTVLAGGNVGIGTTSPTTKLDVAGGAYISGSVRIVDPSLNVNADMLTIGNDLHATNTKDSWIKFIGGQATNDKTWGIGNTTNYFSISYLGSRTGSMTEGTNAFIVTNAGNVGIGTTSPTSLLHLSGSNQIANFNSLTDTSAVYARFGTAGSTGQAYIGVEGSGAGGINTDTLAYATYLGASASGTSLQFGTPSGVRMTISSAGDVGIGTASPSGSLHVFSGDAGGGTASTGADDVIIEHSTDGGLTLLTPNASVSTIFFGSPADTSGARMVWGHSSGLFTVGTSIVGGSLKLVGDNNVTNLTLSGASGAERADFSKDVYISGSLITLSNATFGGNISGSSTSSGSFGHLRVGGNSIMGGDVSIGNGQMFTGAGSRYLTIDATSYPGIFLSVGATRYSEFLGYSTYTRLGAYGARELRLATNDTTAITINSSQSSSFGTATAEAGYRVNIDGGLYVSSSIGGASVFKVEGTSGSLFEVNDSFDGILMSVNDSSGVPILNVSSSGNIGINKPNAIYELDVNGTGSFTGDLYVSGNLNVLGDITLDDVSSDTGSFGVVHASNKIGIGTTAPVTELTVSGSVTTFHNSVNATYANFKTGNTLGGVSFYDANYAGSIYVRNASGTATTVLDSNGVSYFTGGNVIVGGSADNGRKFQVEGTTSLGGTTSVTGSLNVVSASTSVNIDRISGDGDVLRLQSNGDFRFGFETISGTGEDLYGYYNSSTTRNLSFKNIGAGSLVAQVTGSLNVTGNINGAIISASSFQGNGGALTGITSSAAPAGSDGQIQYNNGGVAGGTTNLFYDDGNHYVGIGTDTPVVLLHVSTSADNVGRFQSSDANAYIQVNDSNDSFYIGTDSQYGYFGGQASLSTTNMAISLTTGNVGIKTTTPTAELTVSGSTHLSGSLTIVKSNGTAGAGLLIQAVADDSYIDFNKNGSRAWTFWNDASYSGVGTDVMRITGDGGLTDDHILLLQDKSTQFKGSVQVTGSAYVTGNISGNVISGSVFQGNGGQLTGITASAAPDGSDGQIQYNNGGVAGGTTALFYDDGNDFVGIGKSGSLDARISSQVSAGSQYAYKVFNTSGTNIGGIFVDGSGNAELYLKTTAGSDSIKLDSSGDSFFNGGNVGIKTTTPTAELTVSGSVNVSGSLEAQDVISVDDHNNNSAYQFAVKYGSNSPSFTWGRDNATGKMTYIATENSNGFIFKSSAGSPGNMQINLNTQVTGSLGVSGVVTTSQVTLTTGGAGSAGTMYKSPTNGTYIWGASGSANDYTLANASGDTWLLLPTGTTEPRFIGNVKIDQSLWVTGSVNISGNIGVGTETSPSFGTGAGIDIKQAGPATLRLENSVAVKAFELYVGTDGNVHYDMMNSAMNNIFDANVQVTGSISTTSTIAGSGSLTMTGLPYVRLKRDDRGADEKVWLWGWNGNAFALGTATDAYGSGNNAMEITRTGTTIGNILLKSNTQVTGSLSVTGAITGASKSFLIDNPQTNGKLQYGSLEGPAFDVYFRGKTTESSIKMPTEWEWLVDKSTITVQLTSIGGKYFKGADRHWVVDITDDEIIIESETGNINCFYIVHGTRKDIEPLKTHI